MQVQYTAPPTGDMGVTQARARLIVEYGNHCLRCGFVPAEDETPLAVDHIIPIARGGRNRYGNYQLLCTPCNNWKGTKTLDFRPGLPRGRVRDDLPIIPEEERHRKRSLKMVPSLPQEPEQVVVPIMVPLPPTPHDCYGALPKLFTEYKSSIDRVAQLSEKCARLEARANVFEKEQPKLESERRSAVDDAQRQKERAERLQKDYDAACSFINVCSLAAVVFFLLFLTSIGFAVYPFLR